MPPIKDITNQRFGRLIALQPTDKRVHGRVIWLCHCICGNLVGVAGCNLLSGNTKSCGCFLREASRKTMTKLNFKHGDATEGKYLRLYDSWANMKYRCVNKNHAAYKWYGKRGILVCNEWRDDYLIFKNWALQNGYEKHLTIDRIDTSGNYEPNNCQWITKSENSVKASIERWKK